MNFIDRFKLENEETDNKEMDDITFDDLIEALPKPNIEDAKKDFLALMDMYATGYENMYKRLYKIMPRKQIKELYLEILKGLK